MPNILDSIQVSGSSYDIKDKNAPSVSAVTQQEYDNLPSSAKTSNTFFVITDAQAGDLTQYWTSAQTQSAITQATSGKVNTSSVVSSVTSASTDSEIPTAKAVFDAIPTGGTGGGKAISAGTNISVTTGETADTVSCTLNLTNGTGFRSIKGYGYANDANGNYSFAFGATCKAGGESDFIVGNSNTSIGGSLAKYATILGSSNVRSGSTTVEGVMNIDGFSSSLICGSHNYSENGSQFISGYYNKSYNFGETTNGVFNNSVSASTTFGDSGNTLFSVGNGTANNARHNAFEIRQNGDIYLSSGGTDIKLQDHLGGGGSSYTAGRGISIANDTISFNLPISATSSNSGLIFNIIDGNSKNNAGGQYASAFGISNKANGRASFVIGASNTGTGEYSFAGGNNSEARGIESFALGYMAKAIGDYSIAFGSYFPLANNTAEVAIGKANVSNTGSTTADKTLFSVGNGTSSSARHNAFEIRQNGDIYLSLNGQDVKLQDQLGGGSSYSAGTGIDITNNVISVTGKVDTSAITTAVTSSSTDAQVPSAKAVNDKLGGLSLVKLTQAEYDALATKDNSTLYVIIN